jgi:hypothetical protein
LRSLEIYDSCPAYLRFQSSSYEVDECTITSYFSIYLWSWMILPFKSLFKFIRSWCLATVYSSFEYLILQSYTYLPLFSRLDLKVLISTYHCCCYFNNWLRLYYRWRNAYIYYCLDFNNSFNLNIYWESIANWFSYYVICPRLDCIYITWI